VCVCVLQSCRRCDGAGRGGWGKEGEGGGADDGSVDVQMYRTGQDGKDFGRTFDFVSIPSLPSMVRKEKKKKKDWKKRLEKNKRKKRSETTGAYLEPSVAAICHSKPDASAGNRWEAFTAAVSVTKGQFNRGVYTPSPHTHTHTCTHKGGQFGEIAQLKPRANHFHVRAGRST